MRPDRPLGPSGLRVHGEPEPAQSMAHDVPGWALGGSHGQVDFTLREVGQVVAAAEIDV